MKTIILILILALSVNASITVFGHIERACFDTPCPQNVPTFSETRRCTITLYTANFERIKTTRVNYFFNYSITFEPLQFVDTYHATVENCPQDIYLTLYNIDFQLIDGTENMNNGAVLYLR